MDVAIQWFDPMDSRVVSGMDKRSAAMPAPEKAGLGHATQTTVPSGSIHPVQLAIWNLRASPEIWEFAVCEPLCEPPTPLPTRQWHTDTLLQE